MNIGYFVNFKWYPPETGGGIHTYQVVSQLAKRGHSICTIFYEYKIPNLTIYRQRYLLKFLKDMDVLYIRTHGTNGSLEAEKFTLLKILKLFSLPVVWEINAPLDELLTFGFSAKEIGKFHQKRALMAKLVDAAICVSKELKEYATKALGIKNCYVIPNGSDSSLFHPRKKQAGIYDGYDKYFKVIWTGSSRYTWQGFNIILRVAEKMSNIDKKVVFIIITEKNNLSHHYFDAKNIVVLDKKEYSVLPPYIASANAGLCLYHNYKWNGKFYFSPLKLFDYMACGLPVIATNIGQIAEVINDRENGILVEGNDVNKIVNDILFLKNNPEISKEISQEARNCIESYYNWPRVAYETEKVFSSLI